MLLAIKQDLHYLLYALANSAAMNGVNSTTHSVDVMTWWRATYMTCIGVFAAATLAGLVAYSVSRVRKPKERKK